jgi:hypothetical protein
LLKLVDVVQAVFLFEITAFLYLSLIRMMKKMAIKSDSRDTGFLSTASRRPAQVRLLQLDR